MKRFAAEKPENCIRCRMWKNGGCELGGKRNCYYLLPKIEINRKSPCENCCYLTNNPCVGFCMKNITGEPGGRVR